MKIKILSSSGWYRNRVGTEFEQVEYDTHHPRLRFYVDGQGWIYESDCVITELPESFCVKICDDGIKWGKYIQWLNKTYNTDLCGRLFNFDNPSDRPYYGVINDEGWGVKLPFGTEIHIDDMIKHIDYMESQQHIKGGEQFSKESQLTVKMNKEFDLTTNEGRLEYARKYYPIGTKYIPLYSTGKSWGNIKTVNYNTELLENGTIDGGLGFVYASGKWAEIVKEEKNMEKQKLSRQGLKEIHSVACSSWKETLEQFGRRNPLEDYIELSQEEINIMFDACTKEQLPIVSKYLKKDDGSVNVSNFSGDIRNGDKDIIRIRKYEEYTDKGFWLSNDYDWEIKTDSDSELCLIPTKKK